MIMDLDQARTAALDPRESMLVMEAELRRNASTIFPAVWCEHASIAVAEASANREMGPWRFVTAGEADLLPRHTWLDRQVELVQQAEWTGSSVEGYAGQDHETE